MIRGIFPRAPREQAMGTKEITNPDFEPIPDPESRTERSPAVLVNEAIRRDLLTLAGLPGQNEVRSTYRRELKSPTAA